MSKEEIENILVITNVQTICKNTLTPEDKIYAEDALIIINHYKSDDETIVRQETLSENLLYSIGFIVMVLLCGNTFRNIEKLFVKTYIRDILKSYEPLFRQINKKELEKMRRILEVKKQNLAMIGETSNNNEENEVYSLRLKKSESHQ